MKLESIAFGIIMFFAIIGCIVFSTAIHELSHYYDFNKNNTVKTEEICALNLPTHPSYLLNASNLLKFGAGNYAYRYEYHNRTIEDKVMT